MGESRCIYRFELRFAIREVFEPVKLTPSCFDVNACAYARLAHCHASVLASFSEAPRAPQAHYFLLSKSNRLAAVYFVNSGECDPEKALDRVRDAHITGTVPVCPTLLAQPSDQYSGRGFS